ncbi:MAG: amidohydrolase family protein [Spirochaetes bacterium]|nr:amidohydrolase family protein [Spirochaetota bacterium]
MKADTVIKNCTIARHDGTVHAGIAVKDGKIAAVCADEMLPDASRVIDAKGGYVIPGCIDPHVHVDWPEWDFTEGTVSTTKAAAAGGVTTIINHLSGPGSLVDIFEERKAAIERSSIVDAAFHIGIFSLAQVGQIEEVAALGVSSFKFFLPYRGTEVVPPLVGIDDGIVYAGFETIARLTRPARALVHAENVEIFFMLKERVLATGRGDEAGWDEVRPEVCEIDGIRRVITFCEHTGCPAYIVHISTGEGAEAVRDAKARGVDIVGETCPQYLTLSEEDVDRTLGKVNPPIRRNREHSKRLWELLASGGLDCIGSDHAPCAKKHKKEFWDAYVGVAGIQTLLPVMLSEGVNRGRIPLTKLVEITSYNTARTFGLYPKKGAIEVGGDADLVLLDMEKTQTVRSERLHHISDFSLFEGKKLTGWPVLTMVRGNVVMEEGEVTKEAGGGRFVPRPAR